VLYFAELRRLIPIIQIGGLTKAQNDKSMEFVLHVKKNYDYRLESKE